MVNNYMGRRFWELPARLVGNYNYFDANSHWERRWQWCRQFPKFMGFNAPWKPNGYRGEYDGYK